MQICGTSNARADALELVDAARRLDENAVGAGADVALRPAHGLVEVIDRARIGARENPGFRIDPLRTGRPDFRLGELSGNDFLADHVPATLGPLLVLDQDGAHSHALISLNRVHHVLDVAVAVVAIHEHRQVAGGHDVAHGRCDFAKALQPDVGHAIARADGRETADEIGFEADFLDEPRAERVMGTGNDEEPLLLTALFMIWRKLVGIERIHPAKSGLVSISIPSSDPPGRCGKRIGTLEFPSIPGACDFSVGSCGDGHDAVGQLQTFRASAIFELPGDRS